MSTKFSRTPRIQPTPPVCRRPPIPEPPGAPIETLHAWFEFQGNDYFGRPADFTGTATLESVGAQPETSYRGQTSDRTPRAEFELERTHAPEEWTLIIRYYAPTGDAIDCVAILPASDHPPATGRPITTLLPLPPEAYAQARLFL